MRFKHSALILVMLLSLASSLGAQTAQKATLQAPVPGSTLTGASATFQWTPGALATEYWLDVSTTPGGNQIYNKSAGTAQSVTVTGLPTDGKTIFVRLWTRSTSGWDFNAHMLTAASLPQVKAAMTSPAAGSKLAGSIVTFNWSAGSSANEYWIDVNTGGSSLFVNKSAALATSATVSGLPTDGRGITVRLWTRFGSTWVFNSTSYTAAGQADALAALTSPTPGSRLAGSAVTFGWSTGSNALEYWLDVNTGGSALFYNRSAGLATSATVSGLPTDGRSLTVRLWTKHASGWRSTPYTFTAAGTLVLTKATLTSPAAGSVLPQGNVTVTWSAGVGATGYYLSVRSGDTALFNADTGMVRQATVTGLPSDGRALVLRVWTKLNGTWDFNDYPVTAFTAAAQSSPSNFAQHNLNVINQYRASKGVAPLALDTTLSVFAQAGTVQTTVDHIPHAHFQAAINAGTLFTTAGFRSSAAENQGDPNGWTVLASDPTSNTVAQINAIQAAMFAEGPGGGHYDNMMAPRFTRVGIGLVTIAGKLYLTNDFSQ